MDRVLMQAIQAINQCETRSFSVDMADDMSDGVHIPVIEKKFYIHTHKETGRGKPSLLIMCGDGWELFRRTLGGFTYEIKNGKHVYDTLIKFTFSDGLVVKIVGKNKERKNE